MDLDTAKVIQDIFNHKVDLLSKNTIFQFCRVPLLSSTPAPDPISSTDGPLPNRSFISQIYHFQLIIVLI